VRNIDPKGRRRRSVRTAAVPGLLQPPSCCGRSGTADHPGADLRLVHTGVMSIDVWWPKLQPGTRDWLIANNGGVVPAPIVKEIQEAGGPLRSDAWWVTQDGSTGTCMPDAATDWIEEIANGETPGVE
jgi:hypothetical protein